MLRQLLNLIFQFCCFEGDKNKVMIVKITAWFNRMWHHVLLPSLASRDHAVVERKCALLPITE